jgi:hypothetical protein
MAPTKPYKCAWCGRVFQKGFYYRQHEGVHMSRELRPYEAVRWSRAFPQQENMEKHIISKKTGQNEVINKEIEKLTLIQTLVIGGLVLLKTYSDEVDEEEVKKQQEHLESFGQLLEDTIQQLAGNLNIMQ